MIDKKTIINASSHIKTRYDLLNLINLINVDLFGEDSHLFTDKQLSYYCNPNHIFKRYREFSIPKKSGGVRIISAPYKSLKVLQTCLNIILQAIYEPSKYATGFAPGLSVIDNARKHVNQHYVFNIDLQDFFPSIKQARVWKRLQLKPCEFNRDIASIIAGICSIRKEIQDTGEYVYVLPQGSPTSPIITNMICDNLDRRLGGLAKRFGLVYSRYADDITFSSQYNAFAEGGTFRLELERIISGQGFTINSKKTRLRCQGERQEVTGITVNTKINVPPKYVLGIRSILHIWEKYGYQVATSKFISYYKISKNTIDAPDINKVLEGKLLYLKMVKGDQDPQYHNLRRRYDELKKSLASSSRESSMNHAIYLETLSLNEFEKRNAEIVFYFHYDGKGARRYASFTKDNKKRPIYISKKVQEELSAKTDKNKYDISRCRDGEREFYLLHKPLKSSSSNNQDKKCILTDNNLDVMLDGLVKSGFDLNNLL